MHRSDISIWHGCHVGNFFNINNILHTSTLFSDDCSVESENCVNREVFWLLIHTNVILNLLLIKGLEDWRWFNRDGLGSLSPETLSKHRKSHLTFSCAEVFFDQIHVVFGYVPTRWIISHQTSAIPVRIQPFNATH